MVSGTRRRRLNAYERLDKADRHVFDASTCGIEDKAERRGGEEEEEEEVRIKERKQTARSGREEAGCGDVKLLSGRFLGFACWFAECVVAGFL